MNTEIIHEEDGTSAGPKLGCVECKETVSTFWACLPEYLTVGVLGSDCGHVLASTRI